MKVNFLQFLHIIPAVEFGRLLLASCGLFSRQWFLVSSLFMPFYGHHMVDLKNFWDRTQHLSSEQGKSHSKCSGTFSSSEKLFFNACIYLIYSPWHVHVYPIDKITGSSRPAFLWTPSWPRPLPEGGGAPPRGGGASHSSQLPQKMSGIPFPL